MPALGTPSAARPVGLCHLSLAPFFGPVAATLLLAQALPAQADECRLALVLALDVSGSVSAAEDRLQRGGLAAALLAPDVVRAFLTGEPVALYVFEWAGTSSQVPLIPGWAMIESAEDLTRVAGAIAQSQRVELQAELSSTAVGAALLHASEVLAKGPSCRTWTVDVSGDGENSRGPEPDEVYRTGRLDGVTVNALVIDVPEDDPFVAMRTGDDGGLAGWFANAVVHGALSFHVVADGFEDYERAMTAKLLRELEAPMVSGWPSADGAG